MMNKQVKIAVIGGGSWATAIVKMLSENLDTVGWYMRNEQAIAHIKKEGNNPNYISSAQFDPSKLALSSDINAVVSNADYIVLAIPSAFLLTGLEDLTVSFEGKFIFSAIKGIVPESSLIVGEHLNQYMNVPIDKIGVITGPCHAEEVALERLSYLTVASQNQKAAKLMAASISCYYIKTKISDDIYGTENAAVLKNIYAIAAGIAHGCGFGDNFHAVLMSNAIREIGRFINQVKPIARDINDSAYLGDLLVTGYSTFSRNRWFGTMLGKGYSVKAAMAEMNMVAEGYYAVKSIHQLNKKYGISMPIAETVYKIIYKGKNVKKQLNKLTDLLD